MTETAKPGPCPHCGAGPQARKVSTALGGWWTVACKNCGRVLERGNGDTRPAGEE